MRAEVQEIAQAAAEDVKKAAAEAARAAFPDDREKAVELELYLTQIPATVRQSLRCTDVPVCVQSFVAINFVVKIGYCSEVIWVSVKK